MLCETNQRKIKKIKKNCLRDHRKLMDEWPNDKMIWLKAADEREKFTNKK